MQGLTFTLYSDALMHTHTHTPTGCTELSVCINSVWRGSSLLRLLNSEWQRERKKISEETVNFALPLNLQPSFVHFHYVTLDFKLLPGVLVLRRCQHVSKQKRRDQIRHAFPQESIQTPGFLLQHVKAGWRKEETGSQSSNNTFLIKHKLILLLTISRMSWNLSIVLSKKKKRSKTWITFVFLCALHYV